MKFRCIFPPWRPQIWETPLSSYPFLRQRCAWARKMKRHLVSNSLAGSCVRSWARAVLLHNKIHTGYLSRAISHVCRIQRLSSPRQRSKANCFLQPVNLSSIAASCMSLCFVFSRWCIFFLTDLNSLGEIKSFSRVYLDSFNRWTHTLRPRKFSWLFLVDPYRHPHLSRATAILISISVNWFCLLESWT